ncbi:MAG: DUF4193 family protein [bacterium]|nr:DUF4193 family protein [bacterium]MDE0602471.1 DUF4193 family protein [bacterium]
MRNESDFGEVFEDEELDSDLEDEYEPGGDVNDGSSYDDKSDGDDSEADDELSGLEGEELNMVDEGVSGEEVLTSEQAMEVAGIRRAELSINPDDHAIRQNEFLCESCFLVKRITQRSSPRSKICIDCR